MATAIFPTSSASENLAKRILSNSAVQNVALEDCRVYKKRWLMLTIYSLCAVADAMHWVQYTIIPETIRDYYDVSMYVIDLTAISFSLMFVTFVFPAIYFIEKFGLKNMLICGDVMIIAASGLKLASVNPKHFYIGFTGQLLAGIAQVFIINVPSYLAGLWFPENEVSTACALGVLGTQIGICFGFYVPPQLISIGEKFWSNGKKGTKIGLLFVYTYQLILPVVLLPLLVFFFKSYPPQPPSYARLGKDDATEIRWSAIKEIFVNVNYILVLISYSLNVSVFYCVSTLLGQIITRAEFAGSVGAITIIFGIAGCFIFGWLLDKTHHFKAISLIAYAAAMVGLAMFWVNAAWDWHDSIYIISATIIGVFLGGYVIISIEFASELTYPVSEIVSTSVLLASGEGISVIFIYGTAALMETYGKHTMAYTTLALMLVGLVPTSLTRKIRLKRHEASQQDLRSERILNNL